MKMLKLMLKLKQLSAQAFYHVIRRWQYTDERFCDDAGERLHTLSEVLQVSSQPVTAMTGADTLGSTSYLKSQEKLVWKWRIKTNSWSR